MKKILFVAASAVLLAAGCQKTEIINPVGEPSMVFSTGLNKLTKAYGTADAEKEGMVNLQAQDFRVWAFTNYADEINTVAVGDVYDHMANLNVGYSVVKDESGTVSSSSWGTKKQYYWPGAKKNLMFYAISGVDCGADLSETKNVLVDSKNKTIAVPNFTVDPASANVDLMVADVVDQHQADKQVDLNFRHALSKVEFLFKTAKSDDLRVLVQNIVVEDLVAKGDLAVTLDEANKAEKTENANDTEDVTSTVYPVVFDWKATEGSTPVDFTDDYAVKYTTWSWGKGDDATTEIELIDGTKVADPAAAEDFDITAMELTNTAEPFATWLMIPQEITGKKVTVTYIINSRQFEAVFALDHTSLVNAETEKAEWGTNQYVRYVVTLTPNVISFNPTVTPWDKDVDGDKVEDDDINMNN